MAILPIHLSAHLEKLLKDLIKTRGSNKAEVVHASLQLLAEEEAVQAVLKAEREPALSGDLRQLIKI